MMKQTTPLLFFCLLATSVAGTAGQDAHLGQVAPGTTPQVFAPGVVSKGNVHSRLVISPDGKELFWNTVNMTTFTTQILSIKNVDGKRTEPQPPSFARGASTQSPMFSPDGKRLYFEVQTEKGWTTKYVERSGPGWSDARSDGFLPDCTSSFTRSGRAYLSAGMKTKVWNTGIAAADYSAKGYANVSALADVINVPGAIDYTPFIAPDESFLLFSSNRPLVNDKEDMHIHVSFRTGDRTWSTPRKMFDIHGRFPSLSPDGKYLFFCGDDGNVYWVEASIIDSLKPPSQAATAIVAKLNAMLATSCARQPALELAGDGTIVRKDADGSAYTFAFGAVDAIDIDRDNEAHVLLKCKAGNPCVERIDASKTSMSLVAFSIYPIELGDEVARLFKDLRAAVGAGAQK